MEFIKWDSSFETDIKIIDVQHKVLIKKVNQLYEFIEDNSINKIYPLIDELLEFTDYHFETEENYFAVFNYKDKEEHINEHNTFRNFVNDIKKEDISNIEFDKKLFEFLNTWILHHIKEVDMKYVDFLKKHLL